MIIKGKRTDLIELERLARLGIISIWRCVLPVWVEIIRVTGYFFEVVLQGKDIGRGSRMFVVKKEKFLRNKIRLSRG